MERGRDYDDDDDRNGRDSRDRDDSDRRDERRDDYDRRRDDRRDDHARRDDHRDDRGREEARSRERSRSPEPRRQDDESRNPGNNLYVSGLSSRTTERDLEDHFNREAKVVDCRLVVDPRSKESRGFAFIMVETNQDAQRCVKYLDRSVLQGRVIAVQLAKRSRPRTPTPGQFLGVRPVREQLTRGYDRGGGRGYDRDPPRRSPDYGERRRDRSPDYAPYRGSGYR